MSNTTLEGIELMQLVPVQHALRHEWWSSVLRTSIATQIKALRESRGWTQAELAERLETSGPVVSLLENPNSKHPPTIQTLLRVAEVFDVALLVRFTSWGKAVAIMAGAVIPLPYEQEAGGGQCAVRP